MDIENIPEILEWEADPWDYNPGDSNPSNSSFEIVLDTACERLREKQVQFSLRRINEMEGRLDMLEKELDKFLGKGS